jgi:primosomal protein N' (replication factor Y)
MPKYARVIVDQSGSQVFDYEIPEALEAKIAIGSRVRVPVRMRLALATVIEVTDQSEVKGIRPIEHVIGDKPIFNPSLIRLGKWIADYYCCPIEVAMRSILPQVIRQAEVGHKKRLFASLLREVEPEELAGIAKKAPKQAEVVEFLRAAGGSAAIAKLTEECGASSQTLQALAKKGIVKTSEEVVQRDPHAQEQFLHSPKLALNEEQETVFERVKTAIASVENGSPEPVRPLLLYGVTGSGKTEIYLQAIEQVLALGKTAIVLVPEISLTPQTVERFKSRFSELQHGVAVLHSHLSQGERHDEWHKINDGQARIVIGARSAVFAPVSDLGLIVVDEEHENSYKQEEAPRYHARDIAVLRASFEKCVILLGSATPSIESFHNATTGKYELLQLTKRVDSQKMPFIRVVDMRLESLKQKGPAMLSDRLFGAITDRLAKKEQTILFLNRRGFSTSLMCPQCGYVCECPNCSVSLTFHRAAAKIVCHICGHNAPAPAKCPDCKDPKIRYSGTGTEKIEEHVARIFPSAVVRRMDADAMSRKEAYRETLGAFRAGKIDILIGTQMISKGLHFPNVTLVGIINADMGLHLPDFRAGERTFQLLTQVAGRAGRGEVEGEVFIQSHTPFHPAIQFARHHDFEGFWDQEIQFRKQWDYPPYTHMVLITVRSPHELKASFSTDTLARRLKEDLPPGTNLGNPAPAPLERSHGNYRFQIMLRTKSILKFTRHLRAVLDKLTFPEDVIVTIDVDPYQLL